MGIMNKPYMHVRNVFIKHESMRINMYCDRSRTNGRCMNVERITWLEASERVLNNRNHGYSTVFMWDWWHKCHQLIYSHLVFFRNDQMTGFSTETRFRSFFLFRCHLSRHFRPWTYWNGKCINIVLNVGVGRHPLWSHTNVPYSCIHWCVGDISASVARSLFIAYDATINLHFLYS